VESSQNEQSEATDEREPLLRRNSGFPAAVPLERPQILLVDDDPDTREAGLRILDKAGYDVVTAAHGKEALNLLVRQPVDLVITDVVMPEMDGLELIKELQQRMPAIPILAMSGELGDRFLKIATALGARATLPKPFSVGDLREAVDALLKPR
jgi:CheY-like chemotaxis protein